MILQGTNSARDVPGSGRGAGTIGPAGWIIASVALVIVYFVAAKAGLQLALVHPSATPVWPPTGICLVAVLWLGWGICPAIFLGALLTNLTTQGNLPTCLGIAAGNTLEALAGAWLVQRYARGLHAFEQASDIIRFAILAGLLSTLISATLGVGSLTLGGFATWSDFGRIWVTWWLGNVSSNLVLAPLLLTWIGSSMPELTRSRMIEGLALIASVLLVGAVVFAGWFPAEVKTYPMGYLGLIPLLWAAFRFGRRGAATAAAIMSAITIYGNLHGYGPFVWRDRNVSLVLLQAFLATITLTALVLAAVVAESRRTHEALRRAGDEARAANNAKDRFIAILSHELRTPLTPVLASLSSMQSTVDPRVREELGMIRRNIELEARLIDDLLDLNRIARGKLELRCEPVNVQRVLDDALQVCRTSNGAALAIHLVTAWEATNSWAQADPARLAQVFHNLVGNAVKFMPEGGTLTVRSDTPFDGMLRVQLIDTGIGIPADELPRLFQPFEQAHNADSRFGGLGLGLAISRSIIEALGGTLEAHSDGRGCGATFTVTLPTTEPPIPQAEPAEVTPLPGALPANGSLEILLVEDHADTARAMARLLELDGHSVRMATTVAQAMQIAARQRFDLVISDIGLPDGTGLELMRDLKSRYNLRGIALTGYGMEQDLRNTADAGFAEHLTKPIDAEDLHAAIARLAACHSQ